MADCACREMTLTEWVDTLPVTHRARDDLARLAGDIAERDRRIAELESIERNLRDSCDTLNEMLSEERARTAELEKELSSFLSSFHELLDTDRVTRLANERDTARERAERAEAEYLRAHGWFSRWYRIGLSAINAWRRAKAERDEARAALDEREADMHMRIRATYDTTVADCWRKRVAKVKAERDEARGWVNEARAALKEADARLARLAEGTRLFPEGKP